MFEPLIKKLDELERGLASASLRSPKKIAALLNGIIGQVNIFMQKADSLPKGSRTALTSLKRIAQDCASGVTGGTLPYQSLRAASRDNIGRYNKTLKLLDAGQLTDQHKKEFRKTENSPTEALITAKVEKIGKLMIDKNVPNHFAKNKEQLLSQIVEIKKQLRDKFGALRQNELVELDPRELVDTHTLEEIAELTIDDLKEYGKTIPDEVRALNESFKKSYLKLPPALKEPFAIIEFPIVPQFVDFTAGSEGKLERAGFKVTQVGEHYIVLEDQHLLVLDIDRLGIKSSGIKAGRGGKLKTVKGDDTSPNSLWNVAGRILAEINKRSSIHYVVASNVAKRNPRNPKLALVWIIPEKARIDLSRSLRTTEVNWDIPTIANV